MRRFCGLVSRARPQERHGYPDLTPAVKAKVLGAERGPGLRSRAPHRRRLRLRSGRARRRRAGQAGADVVYGRTRRQFLALAAGGSGL